MEDASEDATSSDLNTNNELTTATLSGNLDELLCIEYPGNAKLKILTINKQARIVLFTRKCAECY